MSKLYKNDLIYLNKFFRGETLDHYIFNVMINPFLPWDWTFSSDSLLGNVVLYWRHCIIVISCHYSVNQSFFNIKHTWVVRGMMDVLYVYCFNSVANYKHKLSRIESLVSLYWVINCSYRFQN